MNGARNTPPAPSGEVASSRSASESRSLAAEVLLPRFIARRERDVGTILDALERQDFRAIETLGHNMRGNGVSYGFPEISAIGEALENAARARKADWVLGQVSALAKWIDVARQGDDAAARANRTISGTQPKANAVVVATDEDTGTGPRR